MRLDQNKGTEKDLRSYFDSQGYFGRTMKVQSLKLKAVERPGWIQLFEFQVEAKRVEGDWEKLFGICRTDERSDLFEVTLADNQHQSKDDFRRQSEGLITHETVRTQSPFLGLLFVMVVVSVLGVAILALQKAGVLSS